MPAATRVGDADVTHCSGMVRAEGSPNVFVKQDQAYTEAGKTPVSWNFTTMPSEEWKNTLGSALTAYAAGTGKWDDVKKAFVDNWATEYKLANG